MSWYSRETCFVYRRRSYLPIELTSKEGVSEEEIYRGVATEKLQNVIFQVASVAQVWQCSLSLSACLQSDTEYCIAEIYQCVCSYGSIPSSALSGNTNWPLHIMNLSGTLVIYIPHICELRDAMKNQFFWQGHLQEAQALIPKLSKDVRGLMLGGVACGMYLIGTWEAWFPNI